MTRWKANGRPRNSPISSGIRAITRRHFIAGWGKSRRPRYGIERDGNSFTLAGISRATAEKFSAGGGYRRGGRAAGISGHDGRSVLAKRTRHKKSESPLSMDELRKLWRSRVNPYEAKAISQRARATTPDIAGGGGDGLCLAHSFERASVVTEKELLKNALIQGVGMRPWGSEG